MEQGAMKRIEQVVIKRKQLDKAYDEKIQALYTVMENNLEQSEIEYAEKLKQELDQSAGLIKITLPLPYQQ